MNTCARGEKPIFVVGSPRSGTTLLQSILNAHPQIAIAPEEDWLLRLYPKYGIVNNLPLRSVEAFLNDLCSSESFKKYWKMNQQDARTAILRLGKGPSYASIASAIYTRYAEAVAETKTRWGSKVPYYVTHLPTLSRLFPDLQIIHIVRDGRDVLMSMKEREAKGANRFVTSVNLAALQWRLMVERGSSDGKRLGTRHYFQIRYEDLVTEPEAVIQAVSAFLGIDYSQSMLNYYDNAINNKLIHSDRVDNYLMRKIVPAKVGRWHKELADTDVRAYESIAGSTLRANGYEVTTTITLMEQIRGSAMCLGYSLYRLFPGVFKAKVKRTFSRQVTLPSR